MKRVLLPAIAFGILWPTITYIVIDQLTQHGSVPAWGMSRGSLLAVSGLLGAVIWGLCFALLARRWRR